MTEVTVEASGKTLRTIKGPITTTFQYDDCDRLVTQTDARKGDTEFTYFANSTTLSAVIDPADLAANRITEVYHYNPAGRRVATVDSLNQTRRVDYDLRGRVVKEWGSASYPVERIYCSCGKIAELRTYRGGTGWDGTSWPTATAGTFDKTTWTYGTATGLLLAKTDANNAAVTYAYDAAGRMTSRTWARGVVTNYAYDAASGDLLSTTYSDSTPDVTYTYDRRARVATVVDGVGSRTLSYSSYDQLTADALVMTGVGTGTVSYTFDTHARRASLSINFTPTGGGTAFGQYRPYTYETGTGLLASIGYSNGGTYTYLPNSALPASIDLGGSSSTSELSWAPHRDELVTYDNRYSAGTMSAHRFDYTRDATSRITQETQSLLDGQSVFSRAFSYNARSELTSDAGSGLSYDAQGNRTTGYGTAYQANALNQYTTVAGVSWTYDADGNPLSDGVRTFVYDAENRLVQAGTHTFVYDYRHRLVKAVGPSWPSTSPTTSWRLYDGDKVVLREDSVGGYTLRGEYVWGRDLAGRHASGDGTGGLLAVISNGITYLPHYDGRGNIWRFTGGSLRSMNAFGDVAFVNYYPPALIETTLLSLAHGSKEFFYGLGLYNYGRRFYDSKNGRFFGRDPIQEKGGDNLFRFSRNNPINRWDDNGLSDVVTMAPFQVTATRIDPGPSGPIVRAGTQSRNPGIEQFGESEFDWGGSESDDGSGDYESSYCGVGDPNSVELGKGSAKTPTTGSGWGSLMVVYDGKEPADPNNRAHATGAQLQRLATNTVSDPKYAINAQSAVLASAIALENGIDTHSVDYVVVLDHGDSNWHGGMRQQLGDNLLSKSDMSFLSVFVRKGGAVVLYGCSAGDSTGYLQKMANAAGTRVYAFPFDVQLKPGEPLPSPASDWPFKDPVR